MPTTVKKAAEMRKINGDLVQVYPETVTDIVTLNNYSKPGSTSALANGDTVNAALGKLEKAIDNVNTSIAGGVTIKGTLGTGGTISALPASHTKGDAYYAIAGAPTLNGVALEPGDMVICVTTGSTANASHWIAVQNNITTMTGATSSAAGASGLVPAPGAGDQAKVLTGAGTWMELPEGTVDTNTTYTLSVSTSSNTATLTPSEGSAQNVNLPLWVSYGTSLPTSSAVAAMPDGACFLLLSE